MSRKSRASMKTEDCLKHSGSPSTSRSQKSVGTSTRKTPAADKPFSEKPRKAPSRQHSSASLNQSANATSSPRTKHKTASGARTFSSPNMHTVSDKCRKEDTGLGDSGGGRRHTASGMGHSRSGLSRSGSDGTSSSRALKPVSVTAPTRKYSSPNMLASEKSRRERGLPAARSRSSEGRCAGSEKVHTPPQQEEAIILTEEQKAELKQAFSMFEKAGKGRIQTRDLGELLRCLGWNPSEQDLEEARHELEVPGPSGRGTISFADVEAYVARRGGIYYGNNAEEDILVAFQVLDKSGNGKIEVEEFRHFMTTMGERMSQEEVEDLLKSAIRDGHDFIEYKDLMRAMQQHPT